MNAQKYQITTFYKFTLIPESELASLSALLTEQAEKLQIKGLLLIGTEGCNATISGEIQNLADYNKFLQQHPLIGELTFKDSFSEFIPFRRWKVDIRKEIVTLKNEDLKPETNFNNHLSAKEWDAVIENEKDYILIDTRNTYETEVGKFKNAIDLNLSKFSEFPEKVKSLDIPKDKKVLMYCTGGIRCEKAILDMQTAGYENVYQLDGGILKYFEESPDKHYEGECFVFDHRVAVDQKLDATKVYKLCPHCGNPAKEHIKCGLCEKEAIVCHHCLKKPELHSCSKNCAHHYQRKLSSSSGASGNR